MKKLICLFAVLCLIAGTALCETVVIEDIAVETAQVEENIPFDCESFSLTLPAGLTILDENERAGYAAAILADYPESDEPVLMAVDAERGAAVCAATIESEKTYLEAAQSAAESILKKKDVVVETKFGENACACFACAIGGVNYNIYVFTNGAELVCIGICGLDDGATTAILTGLALKKA